MTKGRPGRDHSEETSNIKSSIKVVDVERRESTFEAAPESPVSTETTTQAQSETPHVEPSKINISFPGSELIRSRLPKTFDIAEVIATDWMNDGKFENVPLTQPLAKVVVQQSLRKAKEIEKKVMASPITEKVAMAAFTYAMKAQSLVNEIKAKAKRK